MCTLFTLYNVQYLLPASQLLQATECRTQTRDCGTMKFTHAAFRTRVGQKKNQETGQSYLQF